MGTTALPPPPAGSTKNPPPPAGEKKPTGPSDRGLAGMPPPGAFRIIAIVMAVLLAGFLLLFARSCGRIAEGQQEYRDRLDAQRELVEDLRENWIPQRGEGFAPTLTPTVPPAIPAPAPAVTA